MCLVSHYFLKPGLTWILSFPTSITKNTEHCWKTLASLLAMSERSSTKRKSSDSMSLGPHSTHSHKLEPLDRVQSCRGIALTLELREASSDNYQPLSQDPLVLQHALPPQDMDMEREHLLPGRPSTPSTRSKEHYARVELLAPFFLNVNPGSEKQKRSWRVRMSRRSTMLSIQTVVALITCLCNIAFTA